MKGFSLSFLYLWSDVTGGNHAANVLTLQLELRPYKANPLSLQGGFCIGIKLIVSCGVQTLGKL